MKKFNFVYLYKYPQLLLSILSFMLFSSLLHCNEVLQLQKIISPQEYWADRTIYMESISDAKVITKRKMHFVSLKKIFEMKFYERQDLSGTPVIAMDEKGIAIKGRKVCTWHEGKYSGKSYKGLGAQLRFCPESVPIFTYLVPEQKKRYDSHTDWSEIRGVYGSGDFCHKF